MPPAVPDAMFLNRRTYVVARRAAATLRFLDCDGFGSISCSDWEQSEEATQGGHGHGAAAGGGGG